MRSAVLRRLGAHSGSLPREREGKLVRRGVLAVAIVLGASWLSIPAFVNGFPFVFPDSVDYLVFTPRIYRSPFYGLLIFFFHLDRFIWGPVLAQALIASHLIWVLVRNFAGEPKLAWFAFIVLTVGLFSSLPFFTGFIMPDFFTSVMILTFYLLGFQRAKLGKFEQIYFLLLGCVAICAHVSHLPQAILLAFLVLVLHLCFGNSLPTSLRRGAILSIPIALAVCATMLNNVLIHRVFALFPAGQIFMLANMIEQGPARDYLQEVCPDAKLRICSRGSTLPDKSEEFLWSTDNLQRLGGFEGMREEAGAVVAGTIRTRPSEVVRAMASSIAQTFLVHAPGAELFPLSNDPWMVDVLLKKFGPDTLRAYKASLEARDLIPRAFLRRLDELTFSAAVLALLVGVACSLRLGLVDTLPLTLFVSAALMINNVLCAVGSGVHDRYQARVTWLIALSALLIFARLWRTETARVASGRVVEQSTSPGSAETPAFTQPN
ncbi:MAG: hypothetical protein JOZ30_15340 [Hyphomicrobiales bacterium]|nr:hypothetical protein [Hyphomicrobiales bacterium]